MEIFSVISLQVIRFLVGQKKNKIINKFKEIGAKICGVVKAAFALFNRQAKSIDRKPKLHNILEHYSNIYYLCLCATLIFHR